MATNPTIRTAAGVGIAVLALFSAPQNGRAAESAEHPSARETLAAPRPATFSRPASGDGATVLQSTGRHRLVGAAVGFVAGAGITYVVLHSGGSTSLCDRSANQDAIRPIECAGLVALGGAVGAGIGYLVGGLIGPDRADAARLDRLRIAVLPGTTPDAVTRLALGWQIR